jgi:hypothetical protein
MGSYDVHVVWKYAIEQFYTHNNIPLYIRGTIDKCFGWRLLKAQRRRKTLILIAYPHIKYIYGNVHP